MFVTITKQNETYNKRNKLLSAQLVIVISLICQHVSTLEGHLQDSSTKYIKGTVLQLY